MGGDFFNWTSQVTSFTRIDMVIALIACRAFLRYIKKIHDLFVGYPRTKSQYRLLPDRFMFV